MRKSNALTVSFAILLIIFLVLWIVYVVKNVETKNMDEAARIGVPGKFISLTGGVTHYESGGNDTAQTVILIHGFSVPYYIWDNVFDSLVRQGYHVIRYDEFGRGYSDRPDVDYNPELYRNQLSDLISKLNIKTPVSLAGVSFGGAVVSDFAAHHPDLVDKIILIDPVYVTDVFPSEFIANYVMAFQHEQKAQGQLDDFKYPQRVPGWAEKYKPQMEFKGFRHALISTSHNFAQEKIVDNYKLLDSTHKKILLIWGKDDHTVPFNYSDSLRKILHVEFFPVEDAAHLPYIEKSSVVVPKMISFLKE